MSKFTLEIDLANAGMQTPVDVADALKKVSDRLMGWSDDSDDSGSIRDANGNAVGHWKLDRVLSDNQQAFVDDAERQGHEVKYDYSGRGMYGATCPAVVCKAGKFGTSADFSTDSMGMDMVFYARS